jgi:hypothetical protein
MQTMVSNCQKVLVFENRNGAAKLVAPIIAHKDIQYLPCLMGPGTGLGTVLHMLNSC